MKRKIRVFCDFDGTISAKDVGASLFNHFSGQKNSGTVRLWIEQKISSRECLWRECSYITATKQQMIDALSQIEVARGFSAFVKLLESSKIPLHVVSDGLDFYISAFLDKAGFPNLDVYSNKAHFINGNLYPSSPYFTKGCGFCGTCKGERIKSLSQPDEMAVFIGDGYSDRCAVGVADLLFARGELAKVAVEKSFDYVPFEDFIDVVDYFKKQLLS